MPCRNAALAHLLSEFCRRKKESPRCHGNCERVNFGRYKSLLQQNCISSADEWVPRTESFTGFVLPSHLSVLIWQTPQLYYYLFQESTQSKQNSQFRCDHHCTTCTTAGRTESAHSTHSHSHQPLQPQSSTEAPEGITLFLHFIHLPSSSLSLFSSTHLWLLLKNIFYFYMTTTVIREWERHKWTGLQQNTCSDAQTAYADIQVCVCLYVCPCMSVWYACMCVCFSAYICVCVLN